MAVSAAEYSGSSTSTAVPYRGARTYVLAYGIQFLLILLMAIITLALAIAVNAYGPFETGSALLLAISYSLTFIPFSSAASSAGC